MKVTREVILDLFPVYLSGEASADTKTLVESYLKQDGEFAAQLRAQWSEAAASLPVPPELELRSLRRTRSLVSMRSWLMALGIWLTLLPLSFQTGDGGFRFLLLGDHPIVASVALLLGILCWLAWFLLSRRLKLT
jgi:hypothetical protein